MSEVKRKPGRPKKVVDPNEPVKEKRPRGRPKKIQPIVHVSSTKLEPLKPKKLANNDIVFEATSTRGRIATDYRVNVNGELETVKNANDYFVSKGYLDQGDIKQKPLNYVSSLGGRNGALNVHDYNLTGEPTDISLYSMAKPMFKAANKDINRGLTIRFKKENGYGTPDYIYKTLNRPQTVNSLVKRLREMEVGLTRSVGSDAIDDAYTLDPSYFYVQQADTPRGGKALGNYKIVEHELFTVRNYQSRDDDCLLAVLRSVTKKKDLINSKIRELLDIEKGPISCDEETIKKLANYFSRNIVIYSDEINITNRIFNDSEQSGNKCIATFEYVIPCDVDIQAEETINVLLSDNHYSEIKTFKQIILCKTTGDYKMYTEKEKKTRVLQQGRTFFPKNGDKKKYVYKSRIRVFDIETIFNATTGTLVPYAISWFDYDPSRTDSDFSREEPIICIGENCINEFIKSLQNERVYAFTLIAFNGSRFDNFIIAKEAEKFGILTKVFYSSNSLRDIQIKQHKTLDLCRLCPSSLKKACDDYKTSPKKIDGFKHEIPQEAMFNDTLNQWINENKKKIADYIAADVMSTCSLAVILNQTFGELVEIYPIQTSVGTIARLSYEAFQEHTEKENLPVSPKTREEYDFIRSSLVGGRVQNFCDIGATIEEESVMVDVVSLYPSVMSSAMAHVIDREIPKCLYGFFPLGSALKTDCYQPEFLGFYNCTIVKQPIPNIIPRRIEGQPLDWKYTDSFDAVVSSVSIELILHYGGVIEVRDGIYYQRSTRTMFEDFLKPIIDEKSNQDKLKMEKSPDYNQAKRETCKLIMNSLSGKFAEQIWDDKAEIAKGSMQQMAIDRKMIKGTSTWHSMSGNSVLICGKIEPVYNQKKIKPVQISCFIWEHARAFMYHLIYKKYNPLYTDTDSCLMTVVDYKRFVVENPELQPTKLKQLGQFENETPEPVKGAILIAPKMYYLSDKKARAKGVSESCLIIDDRFVQLFLNMGLKDKFATYYRATELDTVEGLKRYRDHKKSFFEAIRDTGKCWIMQSTLMRSVKEGGFDLLQKYVFKCITKNSIEDVILV